MKTERKKQRTQADTREQTEAQIVRRIQEVLGELNEALEAAVSAGLEVKLNAWNWDPLTRLFLDSVKRDVLSPMLRDTEQPAPQSPPGRSRLMGS